MTPAQRTDQLVRRHLAALIVIAQEGSSADVVRMMRAETCRMVSAISTCMSLHHLDPSGRCHVCQSTNCGLLALVRRALLPVTS
jgi:hypothetical protein